MPTITCVCGKERKVKPAELRRGARWCSWECMRKFSHKPKHGLARVGKEHPLYNFWRSMVSRCTKITDRSYADHGARGIGVDPAWLEDPRPFVRWVEENLGPRPTNAHTIDRINNNLGYFPGNLRWATRSQQAVNQRKAASNTGVRGVHKTRNGTFRAMLYRDNKEIYIGTFSSLEKAAEQLGAARDAYRPPPLTVSR